MPARPERPQLKWLVYAGALVVAAALAGVSAANNLQNAMLSAALALVPVAIGIAVFRYRLYDIDRIISRTLAYAIVTGLLARDLRRAGDADHPGIPGPHVGGGGVPAPPSGQG